MTINQFTAGTLQWAGQGVIAIDRARMLAGQPASMVYFDLSSTDPNLGGMLPADLDGPAPPAGSPGYFVQMDDDAWGYSAGPTAALALPRRLGEPVRIHVHRSESPAHGRVRFGSVRLHAVRPAARDHCTSGRALRPPDVSAAVPQLRHTRVARGQSHRRHRRPGPCRHPLVRGARSPGRRRSSISRARTHPMRTTAASAALRWTASAISRSGSRPRGHARILDPLHRAPGRRPARRADARRSGSDGGRRIADARLGTLGRLQCAARRSESTDARSGTRASTTRRPAKRRGGPASGRSRFRRARARRACRS